MRLPHRLQGQKVKSQGHGAGAYCGGHLAAQLVSTVVFDLDKSLVNNVSLLAEKSTRNHDATVTAYVTLAGKTGPHCSRRPHLLVSILLCVR